LRAKGEKVTLTEEAFAHAIGARKFFLPRELFFLLRPRIGFERLLARIVAVAQSFHIARVIVGSYKLILAAGEKFHKVVEKFSGISEAAEMLQLELGDMPPQEDPVVHFIQHLEIGIGGAQDFFQAE